MQRFTQEFLALNGGPIFKFTEAVSFIVNCKTQKEVDYYWKKLSLGGDKKAQQCGWLKDKYGLSWRAWTARAAAAMKVRVFIGLLLSLSGAWHLSFCRVTDSSVFRRPITPRVLKIFSRIKKQ